MFLSRLPVSPSGSSWASCKFALAYQGPAATPILISRHADNVYVLTLYSTDAKNAHGNSSQLEDIYVPMASVKARTSLCEARDPCLLSSLSTGHCKVLVLHILVSQ